jgi:hypothetical protein
MGAYSFVWFFVSTLPRCSLAATVEPTEIFSPLMINYKESSESRKNIYSIEKSTPVAIG